MMVSGDRLIELNVYLSIACATIYTTLFVFVLVEARLGANRILAISCLATAGWSLVSVVWPQPVMSGITGSFDMIRMICWYLYLLALYRKSGVAPYWHSRGFFIVAFGLATLATIGFLVGQEATTYSLTSIPVVFRLALSVCELLLIENLFLNLPEHARWHVALPCILLGGIACLDILATADAVLFHRPSLAIVSVRTIIMLVIAPLLVLAALRGQRWTERVKLSKAAVFHSATLVLSGLVLLTLGVVGEVLRYVDGEFGWIAELSLLSAGAIALLLLLTSRSARASMSRVVIRHFFSDRFDYRVQWLRCIATLSGTASNERINLPTRAIRAIADVVDSPSGSLFLREPNSGIVTWAGSWNTAAGPFETSAGHVLDALIKDARVAEISTALSSDNLLGSNQVAWLSIPLLHTTEIIGLVIVGKPRTQFKLDQEVFELLTILGREVATHIVERQATENLHQTQNLHDYGKRFAFVAHDIKNVSSQLALLVQNAEIHLADPEFQIDMVQTVQSSVTKIDGLLKRLDQPSVSVSVETLAPAQQLETLVEAYRRTRGVDITFTEDGSTAQIVISPSSFETALIHLLNNAAEAAAGQMLRVSIQHEAERVIIDIIDRGPGMSAEFVQEQLFTPFQTNKRGGSGIGAYQARELLREAGGQLIVLSELGIGTTMRIVFARADRPPSMITRTVSDFVRGVDA